MKPVPENFTFAEKIACTFLGFYIAKEELDRLIESVFIRKKISLKAKNDWLQLFGNEFDSCVNMPVKTKFDCAYLEFKVRHLMDAATNLSFDLPEPWQGYAIQMENTFFPVFKQ